MATMTADRRIAGGPMSLEQMSDYLKELYGVPVALREEGTSIIKSCPYCFEVHHCTEPAGYSAAACWDRTLRIYIGDRSFVPNFGLYIFDYVNKGNGYQLFVPVTDLVPLDEEDGEGGGKSDKVQVEVKAEPEPVEVKVKVPPAKPRVKPAGLSESILEGVIVALDKDMAAGASDGSLIALDEGMAAEDELSLTGLFHEEGLRA